MATEFFKAIDIALDLVHVVERTSYSFTEKALGRVLAEDIYCQKNLPSYNNSALDGFAFNYEDYQQNMNIKSTIFAGEIKEPSLRSGECYKIMTCAKVPKDADTIILFEML